jgi:hypothetical protein
MEAIKAYFSGVKDRFNQDIESVKRLWAGLKEYWSGVKDRFRADVDSVKAKIEEWKNKIEDMKNSAVTKFESLKNSITTKFNAIKTAIMNPIETAKTAVGKAVDWIKSKFNGLSLKLPNIKTPHFKVKNWSLNPADWVRRRPSIAIDWYKEGGFMDKTTLIGAGEGGAEGIVPLEGKHMLPFAQAIGEYLGQREGATNGLSIEIPLVVNGREIARAIGSDIDHELKRRKDIRKRGV